MSYSRKNCSDLYLEHQGPAPAHPNLSLLTINFRKSLQMHIANVYNAPIGSLRAGEAAQLLLSTIDALQPTLILGDFNL